MLGEFITWTELLNLEFLIYTTGKFYTAMTFLF